MSRLVIVLIGALSLGGYNVVNQQHFNSSAAHLVHARMPLLAAESALASAHFACDARSAYPEITCARNRTRFLSGCIERVNLLLDAPRGTVTAIDARPIVCTSF